MKHLIMYNHLGEKEHDYAVFVDGMDFQKSFDIPTCIWLGKIILVDKEPEPEIQEEWIAQQEAVAEKEMREIAIAEEVNLYDLASAGDDGKRIVYITEEEVTPEPEPEYKGISYEEGLQQAIEERTILDSYIKARKGVKEVEPETVSDTSRRDEGVSPAEQPESLEVAPESDTTGDVTLGSEVDRQPTTPENTLGGRSKQRSSRSRRGKAKTTNINVNRVCKE